MGHVKKPITLKLELCSSIFGKKLKRIVRFSFIPFKVIRPVTEYKSKPTLNGIYNIHFGNSIKNIILLKDIGSGYIFAYICIHTYIIISCICTHIFMYM